MRPLDHIPELVGIAYSVAKTPAFVVNGTLYTVSARQLYRSQVIDLVNRNGINLWVFGCDVVQHNPAVISSSFRRMEETSYIVKYAVVKPRLTTQIVLRKFS